MQLGQEQQAVLPQQWCQQGTGEDSSNLIRALSPVSGPWVERYQQTDKVQGRPPSCWGWSTALQVQAAGRGLVQPGARMFQSIWQHHSAYWERTDEAGTGSFQQFHTGGRETAASAEAREVQAGDKHTLLPLRMGRHQSRLLKEAVLPPSLEVFKVQLDKTGSTMAWFHGWACFEQDFGREISLGPFKPELSCDLTL